MDVIVSPSTIEGQVAAPPSKSYSHRAVLAGGYAGDTTVHGALQSADIRATMRAVDAFGGTIAESSESIVIRGFEDGPQVPSDVIDCGNSGTTMRLVTATAALPDGMTVLTGDRSLRSRPHGPLLQAISDLGGEAISTRNNGQAPLVIGGPIDGGAVSMPGDVSSQFVSALLIAGAVIDRGIEIELTTALKSAPYVDVTIEVLDHFGVSVDRRTNGYRVAGGQTYDPVDGSYAVPGDFSSISYLAAAGVLAADSSVTISRAFPSAQGDVAIVEILDRMGATVDWDRAAGEITVEKSPLQGIEVDVGDTPDLLPTVAVLGSVAAGETRIVNCEHVRYKETDRVAAMATELSSMGAVIEEERDVLTISGDESSLVGAVVDTYHDHRIVMALTVAALVANGETVISGAEHVDVSFPTFFDVFSDLGASFTMEDVS